MSRPTWDRYFMDMALLVATRATCNRAQVGAVLVKDRHMISTGYNGAPSGFDHCLDVGCDIVNSHCQRTVHAEVNAIIQCARFGVVTEGSTLYCTHAPCVHCSKAIVNAGIVRVVYLNDWNTDISVLREAGIELLQM